MQLSDKLKEYLINSLMRDKEELERFIEVKEEVIAEMGENNGNLAKQIEDLKYKFYQKDDECCNLKKEVKRLDNDKTFHVNELQKNNNAVKEAVQWKNEFNKQLEANGKLEEKIKELEADLLKKVLIECKPKGKPGRKPKEVK